MKKEEQKQEIKDFFEQYYKKYEKFMTLPSVPAAMLAEQQEEEGEWKKWKLIPATVSDEDLAKLEAQIGVAFPDFFKIF